MGAASEVRAIVLQYQGQWFWDDAGVYGAPHPMPTESHRDDLALEQMYHSFFHCPKPVLARVQGDCGLIGAGLLAVCDIVVTTDKARFCLANDALGSIPAAIAPYVIRTIGARAAQRYFLTAERFDAVTAQRIGLVHEVAPAHALDATVEDLLESMLNTGPRTLRETFNLLRDHA